MAEPDPEQAARVRSGVVLMVAADVLLAAGIAAWIMGSPPAGAPLVLIGLCLTFLSVRRLLDARRGGA
jgi:hypothetical protein